MYMEECDWNLEIDPDVAYSNRAFFTKTLDSIEFMYFSILITYIIMRVYQRVLKQQLSYVFPK